MRRCEGTETEKEVRTDMNKGRIVQVMGPVVDVLFEDGELPNIKDALEVDNGDKTCIMEVAQHLGNSEVRCLMLAASEGLHKDMEVRATGSGIKVPVGDQTLGRLFNVLGQTCLLYTSDAADDLTRVDLGGRRIIKKNFFKQKTAYEITTRLVGSEMCIRDSGRRLGTGRRAAPGPGR